MPTLPGILRGLLRYVFLGMLGLFISSCQDEAASEDVNDVLLAQINALRQSGCTCGGEWMIPVKPLITNVILKEVALGHASDMNSNNYFSHLSLDGKAPIDRARIGGYPGEYVGEVIARRYYTTQAVVNAWKESDSHCRALMDSLYNEMGGARNGNYWVVNLGRSK